MRATSDPGAQSDLDLIAIDFSQLPSSPSGPWQLAMNLDTSDGNIQSYDKSDFWQSTTGTNGASTWTSLSGDYKNLGAFTQPGVTDVLIVVHDGGSSPSAMGWRQWHMDDTGKSLQQYFNEGPNTCSGTTTLNGADYGTLMGSSTAGEVGTLHVAEPMVNNNGQHSKLYSNYRGAGDAANDYNRLTTNDSTGADYNNKGWGLGTNYDSSGCTTGHTGTAIRPQCDAQMHTTSGNWGHSGGIGGMIGSDCVCGDLTWCKPSEKYNYAIFITRKEGRTVRHTYAHEKINTHT